LLSELHDVVHDSHFPRIQGEAFKRMERCSLVNLKEQQDRTIGNLNQIAMKRVDDINTDPQALAEGNVSKLFRHLGGFDWNHISPVEYKSEDGSWTEVTRRVFTGETGESPNFHVRYFEIAKGGHSTLEQHLHEHVVVVMRGKGHAIVGEKLVELGFGDVLYVAPDEVHQLSNACDEPFGFLCIVNAERDRPRPVELGEDSYCL
jgi:ribulose-bisphosphate carboxylase large chain